MCSSGTIRMFAGSARIITGLYSISSVRNSSAECRVSSSITVDRAMEIMA